MISNEKEFLDKLRNLLAEYSATLKAEFDACEEDAWINVRVDGHLILSILQIPEAE